MFYNAKPDIFEKAKLIRKRMTPSEQQLWEHLKGKKNLGLRFRPQHPIDIFIVDFYCHPLKLVIEVDGEIHKSEEHKEYDIGRTGELNNWGIEVIRFTNDEVEKDIKKVLESIKQKCIARQLEALKSPL